jgi:hypothetical protein
LQPVATLLRNKNTTLSINCDAPRNVKLAVTGTEPAHVLDYRREHPEFPHQSTSDQIFDEAQFESYRALGECALEKFCEPDLINWDADVTLPQWFGTLRPPELPGKDEPAERPSSAANLLA